MRNGDSGGKRKKKKKKKKKTHLKVRRLDSPRSHTNDQQGCMILTQSLKTVFSFFYAPFQRNKNQAPKHSVWYGPE